jgi:hypothetical protein
MEVAPELQFKHYTLAEVHLPADAVVHLEGIDFAEVAICCDLDSHVFNGDHTEPLVRNALRASHWFEFREWVAHRRAAG